MNVGDTTEAKFPRPAGVNAGAWHRAHAELPDPLRTPFELDRHRIMTCTAFRRLEGKTQVFLAGEHDHFRTRLTHTLEVAEIARTLARLLSADEVLAEAISLAHDLGHPPFGHAGEQALNEAMAAIGGFNHNTHSVRVVDYLEHPFPAFRGLNLTAATRAGLRAHCTRFDRPGEPGAVGEFRHTTEAAVASFADRVAYALHDLEDALGAELITERDLDGLQLWRDASAGLRGDRGVHAIRRAVLDSILNRLLADAATPRRGENAPASSELSLGEQDALPQVEAFLLQRVYRSARVMESDAAGRRIVRELFAAYQADPRLLPDRFFVRIEEQGAQRVIGDYVAGMTDRFCEKEHVRCVRRNSSARHP